MAKRKRLIIIFIGLLIKKEMRERHSKRSSRFLGLSRRPWIRSHWYLFFGIGSFAYGMRLASRQREPKYPERSGKTLQERCMEVLKVALKDPASHARGLESGGTGEDSGSSDPIPSEGGLGRSGLACSNLRHQSPC